MGTLTAHVFPQFGDASFKKLVDLSADTLMVALGNAAGPITLSTPGIQAAKTLADWKAIVPEITGTGYSAGGLALTGVAVSSSGNVETLTATSPVWPSSTITANQAVWYDSTAGRLIAFWDFGGAQSSSGGPFTLTISGSGIITATVT